MQRNTVAQEHIKLHTTAQNTVAHHRKEAGSRGKKMTKEERAGLKRPSRKRKEHRRRGNRRQGNNRE